jgi:penicillin-binding protein 1A
MAEEGYLPPAEADRAATQPLDLVEFSRATPRDPYVVEQVKRELLAEPALGDTLGERVDALFTGGLEIHTSVDWRLQERADELIAGAVGDMDPTAAVLAMDADTGRILVTRSGRDFTQDQYDPALQGRRQPGSAFKAFVLATALEQGMSPSDPINANSPAVLEFGGTRPWHVTNYAGNSYGVIPLEEAFARSSNTAFARLILRVGQSSVEDVLERLGIDVDAALGRERGLSPAIALGGVRRGMTLPEMAAAFGALTGDGRLRPAHVVTKVVGPDGEVLLDREPRPRRAVDADVAAQVRQAMRRVVEEGTGRRAQIEGREVVGKTGTSQQFADAWFVGEVDGLVGAAWVGHPEGRIPMDRMTGGSVPAELWREAVRATLAATGR